MVVNIGDSHTSVESLEQGLGVGLHQCAVYREHRCGRGCRREEERWGR